MSEPTQKIVINQCFGGFGLSAEAERRYRAATTKASIEADDPALVAVVEEMGRDASAGLANLVVVEVPAGVKWHIHEYDGLETVHENHRSWTSRGMDDGDDYC